MNEFEGRTLKNAVPGGVPATLTDGYALYLPGVGSGTGCGGGEALTTSAFSGPQHINRAIHLAGGEVQASSDFTSKSYSIGLWFWLGETSGASNRSGSLISGASSESLRCQQDGRHRVHLALGNARSTVELHADDWHFAVLVCEPGRARLHIDGRANPDFEVPFVPSFDPAHLAIGKGLQGKVDEVAVFRRPLSGEEIAGFWQKSGMAANHARDAARRKEQAEQAQATASRLQDAGDIKFADGYFGAIKELNSIALGMSAKADGKSQGWSPADQIYPLTWVNPHRDTPLGDKWSAAIWFRNDTPNNARPVTAYLISRGPKDDRDAPGDHLGIGGTYKSEYTGKLIVFNGNASNRVVSGSTVLSPGTWNHVVMVRDGNRVRAWLNGAEKAEIDGELPVTAAGVRTVFAGKRCDGFAPLKGNLAQYALFDRALTPVEAKRLYTASGVTATTAKPATTAAAPAANAQLASSPLSPEESLKKWHVREGYRIKLAAAEPVVLDPVAFDWDEKGRLWVVEMADYPLGMDGNGKAGGRVVILEDTNDDARYDKRTVIAEGLNFPTGILTWRDGAIVTAAPDVLFIKAGGEKKLLLTGFSTGNQQLRVNGLRWGMDGWVYCAAGAHNSGYNKGTEITSVLTGEKIALGSRDFRFKPDTGEFDPQSGPSQFGRARDDWGHWFGVQNSFPLWHYQLQDQYLRRNPHVIPPDPIRQLFPRNPRVYPVSSMEKRFHSFGESGRFTSACGIEVYRDRVLFDDGKTHAFTCEPFHNVVQHHVLEEDGVSFKATRDAAESKHDFLASEDRWCRPVMVRTGPDGALWVADMYRYMIEHPQWLPQNGKDELLPHYREGEDKGRIWRVVRDGSNADTPVRSIASNFNEADKNVHAPFESQNGWVRDKAQMSSLWNGLNEKAVAGLGDAMTGSKVPQVRAQAAWTLQLSGKLAPPSLKACLLDENDEVVVQAIQMAENQEWKDVEEALLLLVNGNRFKHPRIRMQFALSAGAWKGDWPADIVGAILDESPPGSPLAGAALSSALPHLIRLSTQFAGTADEGHDAIVGTLFRCAINSGNEDAITALVSQIKSPSRLNEVLAVLDEKGLSLAAFATQIKAPAAQAGMKHGLELLAQAAQVVRKAGDKPPTMELRLLSNDRAHRAEVADMLGGLWKRSSSDAAPSLLPLIARLQPSDAPGFLLAGWNERTPSIRAQIIETLLSSDAWTLALLERIQAKQLEANACDAATRARLLKHPKPEVKKLAGTIFTDSASAARAVVLEKFKPALQLKGDSANGKTIFAQICISCHKLDDVGLELGPDLRSVAQHDGDKLLNSILDPSAVIEPGFMAYHCTLKNGEQLYGVIATETSTSLTLKMPGNVTRSVLRSEVTSLKSTNTSLMPDGLEAALTPQSLADLIAYLKESR
jgi:putative membrane-bound dehydrogenase-like protein